MSVLFAGGIAVLRRVAIQVRFLNTFVKGTTAMGDIFLNHNHYFKYYAVA